jgi:hypothetical protein
MTLTAASRCVGWQYAVAVRTQTPVATPFMAAEVFVSRQSFTIKWPLSTTVEICRALQRN